MTPGTIPHIAAACNRSKSAVRNQRKKLGEAAPALTDVQGWQKVFAATGRDRIKEGSKDESLNTKLTLARLAVLEQNRARLARDNDYRAGLLVSSETARRCIQSIVNYFENQLERLAREMPAVLKAQDEIVINVEMNQQKIKVMAGMEGEKSKFEQEIEAQKEIKQRKIKT